MFRKELNLLALVLKSKIIPRLCFAGYFVLMLLSSLLNDPLKTPDQKDYIYDMKETAIFLAVFGGFTLIITRFRDGWTLLLSRLALFGSVYATAKELSGLNITESPIEYYIFITISLLIVLYSILTWENKMKKT
jgi:hypothetical protein